MILDTNVYIKFCLEPEDRLFQKIVDQKVIAPNFLKLEVVNVLRKLHYFHNIPKGKTDEYEQIIFDEFVPDSELLDLAKVYSFELNHPFTTVFFSL